MRTKPIPAPCTVDNLRARRSGQSEVPLVGRRTSARRQYPKPLFCAAFLMLGPVSGLSQFVFTNTPVTTQENTPLTINISTLITCTNTPGPIRVGISASPAHGTLIITNLSSNFPSVTYVPNLNFTGNDSFMLTVSANNCLDSLYVQPIIVSTGTDISPPP